MRVLDDGLLGKGFCYVYWIHLEEHDDPTTQGYIGYTKNFKRRMRDHRYSYSTWQEKKETHNPCLMQAFDKYGFENTIAEVIFAGDMDSAYEMEKLMRHKPYTGWNVVRGGKSGNVGISPSPEAIEKNRQAKLGKKQSPETIRKRVESRKGYTPTEETRRLMSESISKSLHERYTPEELSDKSRRAAATRKENGYVVSEETREKKRLAMKKYGLASSVIAKGRQHLEDVKNDLGQYGRAFHPKHQYLYECPHGLFGELSTVAELEGRNSPASVRTLFNSDNYPEFIVHKRGTDGYWRCLKKLRDMVPDDILEKYSKYEERVWEGYEGEA